MAQEELDVGDFQNESEDRPSRRRDLATMTPGQALERLRQGKPLCDVCVERLVLSGEFVNPVRLKNCVLVKPRFEQATFKAEVSFIECTLDRPQFSRETLCEGDLILRGSTFQSAQISKLTVKGTLNAEYA